MRRLESLATPRNLRDVSLFVGGLLGVLHETIITTGERPSLLVLFAAMLGLPAFLRGDDRRKDESSSASSSTEPPDTSGGQS